MQVSKSPRVFHFCSAMRTVNRLTPKISASSATFTNSRTMGRQSLW